MDLSLTTPVAAGICWSVAACFAGLLLHTWTYADFLEDPMTWTLLGVGVALASAARTGRASSF